MSKLSWADTELNNLSTKKLSTKDIKQLLLNRGASNQDVKKKKIELIKLLKSEYSVAIQDDEISYFSVEELLPELKLHHINPKPFQFNLKPNKQILIFLLRNLYQSDDKKWESIGNLNPNQILSNPILLNKREYISVGDTSLHKYDYIKNEWIEWIEFPNRTHASSNNGAPICINPQDNKIYLLCKFKLLIIDYQTKTVQTVGNVIDKNIQYQKSKISRYCREIQKPKLIFSNGELSVITNVDGVNDCYPKHWIYDKKTQKLEHHWILKSMEGFDTIYFPSKQKILLFEGGWSRKKRVCQYCYKSREWTKLTDHRSNKLPWDGQHIICLCSNDERNIVVLDRDYGKIFYGKSDDLVFRQSCVNCPKYDFKAIIVKNEMIEKLLTTGFIRNIYNEYKMEMYRFPPQYLIKLIDTRLGIQSEFLHLFITNDSSHFRISLSNVMREVSD